MKLWGIPRVSSIKNEIAEYFSYRFIFGGLYMNGSNHKKGGFIVLAALVLSVCFTVFLLTANFKASVFTITFDANGGDFSVAACRVEEGRYIPTPEAPEGIFFDGWFTDKELENEWIFEIDTVRRDTVLYAKWSVEKYLVSFRERDIQKGGILYIGKIYGSQIVQYGETLSFESAPIATKAGYDFIAWEDEDGNEWDFDTPITQYETVSGGEFSYKTFHLYASWELHTFKIIFKGGEDEKTNFDEKDVVYGGKLVDLPYPPPQIAGATFLGWSIDPDPNSLNLFDFDAAYNYTDDIILYPKYSIDVYTATYEFLDGTSSFEERLFGERFEAPNRPDRNAERCLGWYYYDDVGNFVVWDFENGAKASLVLFETWEVKVVYSGYSEYTERLLSGGFATKYIPEIEGKALAGWYTDPIFENEWNFSDKLTENLILYPRFEVLKFNVEFYNNGSLIGTQIVDYGMTCTAPTGLTPPSAEAFFGGWYFLDESEAKLPSGYAVKSDLKLEAVWYTEETLPNAPAETVRAYYYEKLVEAAIAKQGNGWRELASGILVVLFEGEASTTENYSQIKGYYDANLFLINLL
jgi:hypothetical protein